MYLSLCWVLVLVYFSVVDGVCFKASSTCLCEDDAWTCVSLSPRSTCTPSDKGCECNYETGFCSYPEECFPLEGDVCACYGTYEAHLCEVWDESSECDPSEIACSCADGFCKDVSEEDVCEKDESVCVCNEKGDLCTFWDPKSECHPLFEICDCTRDGWCSYPPCDVNTQMCVCDESECVEWDTFSECEPSSTNCDCDVSTGYCTLVSCDPETDTCVCDASGNCVYWDENSECSPDDSGCTCDIDTGYCKKKDCDPDVDTCVCNTAGNCVYWDEDSNCHPAEDGCQCGANGFCESIYCDPETEICGDVEDCRVYYNYESGDTITCEDVECCMSNSLGESGSTELLMTKCFSGSSWNYDTVIINGEDREYLNNLMSNVLEKENLKSDCATELENVQDEFCSKCQSDIIWTFEYEILFVNMNNILKGITLYEGAIPEGWTCLNYTYGNGECDCDCGAHDIDCDEDVSTVRDRINSCDSMGCNNICENGKCVQRDIPTSYSCSLCSYGTDDGCNCECGALDPDCENSSISDQCDCDEICGTTGKCTYDGSRDIPDEVIWTCSPCWYNNPGSGCNCGCGSYDPDCDNPDEQIEGCSLTTSQCNDEGICYSDQPDFVEMNDWSCPESQYNAGDGICHCGCGIWDPDCEGTPKSTISCFDYEMCVNYSGWSSCEVAGVDMSNIYYYNYSDAYALGLNDPFLYGALLGMPIISEENEQIIFTYNISMIPIIDRLQLREKFIFYFVRILDVPQNTFTYSIEGLNSIVFDFSSTENTQMSWDQIEEIGYSKSFLLPIYDLNSRYSVWQANFKSPNIPHIEDYTCNSGSPIQPIDTEFQRYIPESDLKFKFYEGAETVSLSIIKQIDCTGVYIYTDQSMSSISYTVDSSQVYTSTALDYDENMYEKGVGSFFQICCSDILGKTGSMRDQIELKFYFPLKTNVYIDTVRVLARWYPFGSARILNNNVWTAQRYLKPVEHPIYEWAYSHAQSNIEKNSTFHSLFDSNVIYTRLDILVQTEDLDENREIDIRYVLPLSELLSSSKRQASMMWIDRQYNITGCDFDVFKNLTTLFENTLDNSNSDTLRGNSIMLGALVAVDEWQFCSQYVELISSNEVTLPEQCAQEAACLEYHFQSISTYQNSSVGSENGTVCEKAQKKQQDIQLPSYPQLGVPTGCVPSDISKLKRNSMEYVWMCCETAWEETLTEVVVSFFENDPTVNRTLFLTEYYSYLMGFGGQDAIYQLTADATSIVKASLGQKLLLCENSLVLESIVEVACRCLSENSDCGNVMSRFATSIAAFDLICNEDILQVYEEKISNLKITFTKSSLEFESDVDCDYFTIARIHRGQFEIEYAPSLSSVAVSPQPDRFLITTVVVDNSVVGEMVEDGFVISSLSESVNNMNICVEFFALDSYKRNLTHKKYTIAALAQLNNNSELEVVLTADDKGIVCFNFTGNKMTFFPVALLKDWEEPFFFATWFWLDQVLFILALVLDFSIFLWTCYNFRLYVKEHQQKPKDAIFWELSTVALFLEIILLIIRFFYFVLLSTGSFEKIPVMNSVFADLPYLIFQAIFTAMVARWIQIYHFSMKSKSSGSKMIKIIMIAVNVLSYVISIIFVTAYIIISSQEQDNLVLQCSEESEKNVLLLLSIVYKGFYVVLSISLATLFLVYCTLLWKQLSKSQAVMDKKRGRHGAKKLQRLIIITSFISLFLISQSLLNIVSAVGQANKWDDFPSWLELLLIMILQIIPCTVIVYMFQKHSIMNTFDKKKQKKGSATHVTRSRKDNTELSIISRS